MSRVDPITNYRRFMGLTYVPFAEKSKESRSRFHLFFDLANICETLLLYSQKW